MALREFMKDSNTSSTCLRAIDDAAGGDDNKKAGAAEFCLLLAETMEMGLDALTAAAFHYCSCVAAREQAAAVTPSARKGDDSVFEGTTLTPHSKVEQYGPKNNELEGAAFQILYRRQYEAVTSLQSLSPSGNSVHSNLADSMQLVLELVKADITRILETDQEFQRQVREFSVSARVKEPYSMWKKMLRLGYRHIWQVPDALALRVVLNAKKLSGDEPVEVTQARERALCYYAEKLYQSEFKPVEGNPRFKDYIAKPKRNGYQSLHYTASTQWEGEDWSLEVQVRSGAMHGVAEFGIACHSDYKAQSKKSEGMGHADVSKARDESSDAYIKNLQKWRSEQYGGKSKLLETLEPVESSDMWHSHGREKLFRNRSERLKPYLQALNDVQSDLVRDHVFVFLTKQQGSADRSDSNPTVPGEGTVLALPAGACVLDALRESERTLGLSLVRDHGFAVNGIEATVTRQLQNGDILGIQSPRTTAEMAVQVAA